MGLEIKSFSERALFSSFYQTYLNPPICETQIVKEPSDSLIETLRGLGRGPYYGKIIENDLHTRSLRAVARMVYMTAVGSIIAPAGVLWHTGNALRHFSFEHAYCAYSDLYVIIQTVTAIGLTHFCIEIFTYCISLQEFKKNSSLQDKLYSVIGIPFWCVMSIAIPMMLFGGYNPQTFIPQTVGNKYNRVAMYISLRLRSDLGLVTREGKPLPFASRDNILFQNEDLTANDGKHSRAFQELINLVSGAEYELAYYVHSANKLVNNRVKYAHPLSGSKVAEHFSTLAAKSSSRVSLELLIAEIRLSARKIELLRSIMTDSYELAANGGYGQMFISYMLKKPRYLFDHRNAYSDRNWHVHMFNYGCFPQKPSYAEYNQSSPKQERIPDQENYKVQWLAILKDAKIDQLESDPRTSAAYKSMKLFDKFKSMIQYSKWCMDNKKEPLKAYEVLDLDKGYSIDDLNKAYRKHAQSMHPDKVKESDRGNATQLFQCLNSINELLKKKKENR